MTLDEAKKILKNVKGHAFSNSNGYHPGEIDEALQVALDYLDEPHAGARLHDLKLSMSFCDAVYSGLKTFELRKNDRGFQTGDLIRFTPVRFDVPDQSIERYPEHPIKNKLYEITYILNGWGLNPDCVALGIREIQS